MLGDFAVDYNGRSIRTYTKHSRKVWGFLEYMFAHRRKPVTQDEIVDILWTDGEEISNPANTLKTILHRARTLLDKLQYSEGEIILYSKGSYQVNPEVITLCDYELFEDLCRESTRKGISNKKKLDLLKQALEYYRDDFLANSSNKSWISGYYEKYHSLFVNAALESMSIYSGEGEWDGMVALCNKAIEIDPYIEKFHYYLIEALAKLKRYPSAVEHYEYIGNLFSTRLGISLSDELTDLYRQIRDLGDLTMNDLTVIKDSLNEGHSQTGAFFCDYEFFKDIYRIESRAATRTGQMIFIGLLSVSAKGSDKPSSRVLNNAMGMIFNIIKNSLRRNDIFTKYSEFQYLIMISTVSFDAGEKVINKILLRFKKEHPKSSIRIDTKIQPLMPQQ